MTKQINLTVNQSILIDDVKEITKDKFSVILWHSRVQVKKDVPDAAKK